MTRALARPRFIRTATSAAQAGAFSYRISGPIYTVSDGKDTLRIPLDWAFGQGTTGQTYVYQREGRWYESRVSYFSALQGLDLTIGMQSITPHNLIEAALAAWHRPRR